MSQQTVDAAATGTADPGLVSRFFGVLLSPIETLRAVAARPRVLGMLAIITLMIAGTATAFFNTDVGQLAWEDEAQLRGTEQPAIEQIRPYIGYFGLAPLVVVPAVAVALAGVLYVVFNAVLAGEATFKHVLAVVVHSGIIKAAQQVFVTPLNYYRESLSSRTNVAVFFPMIEEGSFVARLLGTIDLFNVWWIVVLAVGLGVLYRRKAAPIAAGLFLVYAIVALALVALFGPADA